MPENDKMIKLSQSPIDDAEQWKLAIGGFIWAMGQLEFLAIHWCRCLGGDSLKDEAIKKSGFWARKSVVTKAIESSDWSNERKDEALALWRKTNELNDLRNILAHSPVVTNKITGEPGIVNARDLLGERKRGVKAYRHREIASKAEAALLHKSQNRPASFFTIF
ncbi:MAG: hypothetical protein JJT96_20360, partial [Opitutales bacterium]|nr:hypothetical protein [Opitutales bacterium]